MEPQYYLEWGNEMFEAITLVICLVVSILITSYMTYCIKPQFISMAVSLAVTIAVYITALFLIEAEGFEISLLCGQITYIVIERMKYRRGQIVHKIIFFAGCDAALSPLLLAGNEVWEYAVYPCALALCVILAVIERDKKKHPVLSGGMMTFFPLAELFFTIILMLLIHSTDLISSMVLSIVLMMIYGMILWLQVLFDDRRNIQKLNEEMNRWQRESRDYMNTIRSQRHDFNLHLHAISGLIDDGNYEECKAYIEKLVSHANDVNDIMPVCDAAVGSMLYNMREEARRRGSDITYHITYDMENIICNGFECNKIIGNLLQNAIDALETEEEKRFGIKLNIFKRRGNTVIVCENRFTGNPDHIVKVFESGYSTKKNHEGIGLSMVLKTAEQYGGRVYPEFGDDTIKFIVNIPNRLSFEEGEEQD